ncbi:MAG: hypothetical protein K9L70_08730 [Thiohalocapsa sp.]|nr:hypothetical protein [Thiohalocapsa sp.]MCF7989552.1 hypothetical protein [Thiohalocapsa sp.]
MTYHDDIIARVWEQARIIVNRDPRQWRQDECGAWLYRDHYGSTESEFGWWIVDLSTDRDADPALLRAFHHRNGYDLTNNEAKCRVSADRQGLASWQQAGEPRNAEQ